MTHTKSMLLTLCALVLAANLPASALAATHQKAITHKASAGKKTNKNTTVKKGTAKKTILKKKTSAATTKATLHHRNNVKTYNGETTEITFATRCAGYKNKKSLCAKPLHNPSLATAHTKVSHGHSIADAHKARVQKAKKVAMNILMDQLGKPYRWGGSSPHTGFDCSGLVYYAYKDLMKIELPRTANEMYHLRDAAPVEREELQSGDLVFFRTQGRGTADHVGVYVGNGKFIQSPRTGRDIQITSLDNSYWQSHYVGARRVMTAKTLR